MTLNFRVLCSVCCPQVEDELDRLYGARVTLSWEPWDDTSQWCPRCFVERSGFTGRPQWVKRRPVAGRLSWKVVA